MVGTPFQSAANGVSRRQKLLRLDHHLLKARVRTTLRGVGSSSPKNVYVLSGPLYFGRLSPEQTRTLNDFSGQLASFRNRAGTTELAAWKTALNRKSWNELNVFGVAWDLGPVPVVQIGDLEGTPVCITAVPQPRQLSILMDEQANNIAFVASLERYLQACFFEYLSDVWDSLRSVFFRPKQEALEVCRKVREQISLSIIGKLTFLSESDSSRLTAERKAAVRNQYKLEIIETRAAIAVADAAISLLEACLTGREYDKQPLDAAYSLISQVSDESLATNGLLKCARLLDFHTAGDDLSPIGHDLYDGRDWLADMGVACQMVSEVSNLTAKFGVHSLYVFVSHHMGVYASEDFFRIYQKRTAAHYGPNVYVWTGIGRQKHIQLAILAKIWLSDIHLLYLPNSFDLVSGGRKKLRTDADWVVEELFYSRLIGKRFHVIQADGIERGEPNVRQLFLDQLSSFSWVALYKAFDHLLLGLAESDYARLGGEFLPSITEHLKDRIFSVHHPRTDILTDDDLTRFERDYVRSGVRAKLKEILTGFRIALRHDHWKIIQALVRASAVSLQESDESAVTLRQILGAMSSVKRTDRLPVTLQWIDHVVREDLRPHYLAFNGKKFPLIEEGPKRGTSKTYRLALQRFLPIFVETLNISIPGEDLTEMFNEVVNDHTGDLNHAEPKLF